MPTARPHMTRKPNTHGAESAAAAFQGFPPDAFGFFRKLARNNNRDWFQAHKDDYERTCRDPMRALVSALGTNPDKTRITRINRDTRFSEDKSPYRTYIAAGVKGYYISLQAQGLYVGTGIYKPEPAALARLREAMADDDSGPELERLVASLKRRGYQVDTHERLKSAPRGYSMDHPRIALLQMKDLHAGQMFEPAAWLSTPAAVGRIERVMDDTKPLADWLRQHVGGRE